MNEIYNNSTNSISTNYFTRPSLKFNELISFNLVQHHATTTIPFVEDIEIILSPDATIIKDKHGDRKTIVKKCKDDDENRELAVTFGLLKLLGVTPAQVQRMMANAKDYREPKKEKKHAKKDSND